MQNILLAILTILLVMFILCKFQNKTPTELFAISGLNFNPNTNPSENKNKNNNIKVMFFYAPWCGHCNAFKPDWNKFTKWCDKNNIIYEEIDGDQDSNRDTLNTYKIEGFPTVLLSDLNGNIIKEFNESRTYEGLVKFVS